MSTKVKTKELLLFMGSLYRYLRGSVQGQGFKNTSHSLSHKRRQCSGKNMSQW